MVAAPIAQFRFSSAALIAIEQARADWQHRFGDHPEILMIGWGLFEGKDGRRDEGIALGFYPRDQRHEVADSIQIVSGLELVFFAPREHMKHFDNKVIDFSEDRFFFSRPGPV